MMSTYQDVKKHYASKQAWTSRCFTLGCHTSSTTTTAKDVAENQNEAENKNPTTTTTTKEQDAGPLVGW
eukprot:1098906-Ditylum_brightwellii.AAC.1